MSIEPTWVNNIFWGIVLTVWLVELFKLFSGEEVSKFLIGLGFFHVILGILDNFK